MRGVGSAPTAVDFVAGKFPESALQWMSGKSILTFIKAKSSRFLSESNICLVVSSQLLTVFFSSVGVRVVRFPPENVGFFPS